MSFLAEIRRRRVFQIAAVYAVVAWLLVQIVVSIKEPLSLPTWVDTLVIVLLLAGFPIAVILSWARDRSSDEALVSDGSAETGARSPQTPDEPLLNRMRRRDALPNSVAVLPFENLSVDQKDAFFAVGIHESILNQLVKVGDLHVIARTSVLRYADGQTPIPQIAEELRVETVLEGSVQYADNRVRITAQLIDADTGVHLWSEMYDRESSDVFAVQTDIATRIASALEAKLTPRERETLTQRPTESSEAYALYLKAISLSTLAGGIEAAPEESANFLRYLDQAIELDRDFALAYALKAREYAYSMSRPIRLSDELTVAVRDRLARDNAERALMLDPDSGVAYSGLAVAHRFARRDDDAIASLDRALERNPDDPRVLRDAAFFHLYRCRYKSALDVARRIIEIDPALGYVIAAVAFWHKGDLDDAHTHMQKALSLNPRLFAPQIFSGWVALLRGDRARAVESLRVAEGLGVAEAGGATFLPSLAMAYRRLGNLEDAARISSDIEALAQKFVVSDAARALACLAVDDEDAALGFLERAATARSACEDLNEAFIAFNMLPVPVLEQPEFVAVRERLPVTE
jgi:adenylate cyclase